MGYKVTQLTGADLIPEKLRSLDAVVIGIRAFNTRKDLAEPYTGIVRVCRGRRNCRRTVQHRRRPARELAGAVPPAPFARPSDGRASAGDVPGTRSPGADQSESHHCSRFRGLGAGAWSVFPGSNGTNASRRSSPSATQARYPSEGACSWRGMARAISSTPAFRGFGNFPKACPARIGCLRISSRLGK